MSWTEGVRKVYRFQGPVVQSIVSLTSSLRVISLTVLADSIYNILMFFAEKNVSSFCTAKKQHICVSLDVNFNESLTNDVVSFEQLVLDHCLPFYLSIDAKRGFSVKSKTEWQTV